MCGQSERKLPEIMIFLIEISRDKTERLCHAFK